MKFPRFNSHSAQILETAVHKFPDRLFQSLCSSSVLGLLRVSDDHGADFGRVGWGLVKALNCQFLFTRVVATEDGGCLVTVLQKARPRVPIMARADVTGTPGHTSQ